MMWKEHGKTVPRKSAVPKLPKRPAWSIWKHRETGGIYFIPRVLQNLEEIDPTDFRFITTLKYVGCSIGGSSVNFCFEDLEHGGARFLVLPREFDKIMRSSTFYQGVMRGIWRFEKHGTTVAAYLVRELVDEDEGQEQFI